MAAGAAAAAAAAAIAQAIKASGVLVRLEPAEFSKLLNKADAPLVVMSQGGIFKTYFDYLFGYKGLAFFTRSHEQLILPANAELVVSKAIWIPGS